MKILIGIILLGCYLIVPDKGYRGTYILTGKVYVHNIIPLRNKEILFEFGDKKENIRTNSKGIFSIIIPFKSPCQSGNFIDSTRNVETIRTIDSYNPEFIFFKYKGKCISIENYYYSRSKNNFATPEPFTFKYDLKF